MEDMRNNSAYSNRVFFKTLFHFLKPYRGKFLIATLSRFISDIVWLYPAYALGEVVNFLTDYTPGDSFERITVVVTIWFIFILIHTGLRFAAKFIGYRISQKVMLDVYLETTNHMFDLDLSWHTKINSGNKLKKIQKGADSVELILSTWIGTFIKVIVNSFGMVAVLISLDVTIGSAMSVFLVIYFLLSYWYIRKASNAAHIVNVAEEDFTGLLFESINNIRSVKVMSMVVVLYKRLAAAVDDVYTKIKERIFWYRTGEGVKATMGQLFRFGSIIFIFFGVVNGYYEVGFLVMFYAYFDKIWEAVDELTKVTQDVVVAKYGIARMVEVLQEPVNIDDETGKGLLDPNWQKIEVRNLSFDYGDEAVLKDVSFTITRGERIGIMGLSGAGKSTLFKILLKEYDDYEGEILVDGVPFKTISKKDYFKHVAVVLQETEVFNFKLRDNITISNYEQNGNTELFERATTTAHIDELIEALPEKDQTLIGEKGIKLSGGEKQRLGLARAIFKDPQMLFLDEATSHLDIESEEKIQDSLHTFFKSITAIVIAHRLTTIKEMDRILVMENGTIIEEGSFDDLYNKKGRFTELWDKQRL